MRVLVVSLAATASMFGTLMPAGAAPPDDLAAYCRSTQPSVQHQTRCLFTEKAAQERAGRTRAGIAPEAWSQCEAGSSSWAAMEACVRRAAVPQPQPGATGGAVAAPGPVERGDQQADPGGATPAPGGGGPAATRPPQPSPTPTAESPQGTPSTVILGPQPSAAPAAESNRTARPVSEDEAERQLKGVLERSGEPEARCTKKQYGPGWVTICE